MDTGQISQGLRADYTGQLGDQGVNVGQMMQSGVSFEDILLMIAAANRGMAIAPGMAGADALMHDSEIGEADAQSLLTQMKDMVQGDSLTQFILGQTIAENDDLKAQLSEVLDFMANGSDVEKTADVPAAQVQNDATEVISDTDAANADKAEVDKADADAKTDVAPVNAGKSEGKDTEIRTDTKPISENNDNDIKVKTDIVTETEAAKEDTSVTADTPAKAEVNAEKPEEIKADNRVIPRKLDISEGKRPVIRFEPKTEEVGNDETVGHERINGSTFEFKEVYTDEWLTEDEGIVIYNPEIRQQLENIFKGNDPKLKSVGDVVPRKFNISDMDNIPRVILKTGKPELSDLNEITEPKADAKEITNGQKFVIDLLGSISQKDKKLDSFDFSEDIIKADPMQLAGLLDYIRTGVGIPLISDIADREVFRNINTVGSISAERLFDPDEMIKNGEMEIISYTPAVKPLADAKNSAGAEGGSENDSLFGKDTIDFARLMKGVREKVNPFINSLDDDDDFEVKMSDRLTPEDMHTVARRMDISFDRALAELEMNKAEYGAPDEQVARGVAENLLRGRSEFTVKLRPEGLGEILVKLVSDETGKTVLSMVASSQRTADLLNKDLASLQSQLSDHGVEIENNSVKVSETVMPAEHQSDAAFSQFDQRRRDEGEQSNRYRQVRKNLNTDDIRIGGTEFDTDIEVGKTSIDDSALNIKI